MTAYKAFWSVGAERHENLIMVYLWNMVDNQRRHELLETGSKFEPWAHIYRGP